MVQEVARRLGSAGLDFDLFSALVQIRAQLALVRDPTELGERLPQADQVRSVRFIVMNVGATSFALPCILDQPVSAGVQSLFKRHFTDLFMMLGKREQYRIWDTLTVA
jgi:hypothetical protein